ncbi:MAG: universal stress protein [Myxococcota bacterium]
MNEVILVPHDLTPFSDAGLARAGSVRAGGHLHVVHVLPRLDLSHPTVVWPADEDEPRRKHALGALAERLAASGVDLPDVVLHVSIGDPGTRVVELARELGATLIVMPTHGRRGIERMLVGSVAEHVVRFAPCPVLVLPRGATSAPSAEPPPGRAAPREDQADDLAVALEGELRGRAGFLTAARIAIPVGEDPVWWEDALERRLMDRGIEFVDLVFAEAPVPAAKVLSTRFEERFV